VINQTPEILFNRFPRLHSFAIDKLASVKDILLLANSTDAFHLPLSTQAFDEFHESRQLVLHSQDVLDLNDHDVWTFSWGTFFLLLKPTDYYLSSFKPLIFSRWIWKSKFTLKIKAFFWLLANDRLNMKDLLQMKRFCTDNYGFCRLCEDDRLKTRDHLFWNCSLASIAGFRLMLD
jgi:hypothetical protein